MCCLTLLADVGPPNNSAALTFTHGMFEQQERENPTFFHEPFKRLDALQGAYGMDCVITNSIPMKIPISLSRLMEICCLRNNVTPYFPWPLTNNTFLRKLSQLSNALDLSRAAKPHHLYFISYYASLEEKLNTGQ